MRDHAVVLGASMAGLLAARVLAESFERVTVVERDQLPEIGVANGVARPRNEAEPEPEPVKARKGVPQGLQPHLLLCGGAAALDGLFPDLLSGLEAAGVPTMRRFDEVYVEFNGHRFSQAGAADQPIYQAGRPFLEGHVRARMPANVTIRERRPVRGLVFAPGGARVVGITSDGDGTEPAQLAADLVVDATGRTGRTPAWLAEAGYPVPAETRVQVDILYVTAELRLPEPLPAGLERTMVVTPTVDRPVGVGLLQQEGRRWLFTPFGYAGHHPPTDREGMLAILKELAPSRFYELVSSAPWPEQVHAHRYPASLRRRYERLERFPAGLLVLGDAFCSFNPIYGQGMTVAAYQALALRGALLGGDADLARRFFAGAARAVDVAWRMGAEGDLAYPTVPGKGSPATRVLNRYIDAVQATCERDPLVMKQFWRVAWLQDPPTRLFAPRVLRAVAADVARRARASRR